VFSPHCKGRISAGLVVSAQANDPPIRKRGKKKVKKSRV
jgi:hypothetical protein